MDFKVFMLVYVFMYLFTVSHHWIIIQRPILKFLHWWGKLVFPTIETPYIYIYIYIYIKIKAENISKF